uniref:Chemokine interleukin-8-like domain-containing protein n=1 Tax=Jaculus jaculus TaxID=51337 RepID=A0A8C5NZM4_JACJA
MACPVTTVASLLLVLYVCFIPAFTTKKGQKLCSEPRQPWVQRYIRNLNARKQRQQPPAVAKALGIKVRVQRHHGNSTAV